MISRLVMVVYAPGMQSDEQGVLATLAYYGALRWPLTLLEIAERRIDGDGAPHDLGRLLAMLERFVERGYVRAQAGLYTIGEATHDLREHRASREATSADKMYVMLQSARWLQAVPYVRMLAASGSLAMSASGSQSDWDVFAIVQAGRLYTARAGLLAVAWLLGRLRTKAMRTAPDRFCFNHLITTDALALRHRSIFTAHAHAWMVPIYDPWQYATRIRQANHWVHEYTATAMGSSFIRRDVAPSRALRGVRRLAELVLSSPVGDLLEYTLRRWMQARIARNPLTTAPGGRVVADRYELEFHPHSFEVTALARYNATLRRMGLEQFVAHDSGLR